MFVTRVLARLTIFAGLIALPGSIPTAAYAQQAVAIGATDIGGTVVGAAGPEAGAWVIAETTELPTTFARIVVTDDQGRYLIPDLPAANYASGCAVMAWWIRPSSPQSRASFLITRRCRHRTKRRRRIITRRSTGMR